MTADERGEWLDHAASCETCRAVLLVEGTAAPGPPAPRGVIAVGSTLDRYVIDGVLGRGAMGVVYAARDPELDRAVAVKVLHPASAPERLRREAKALAKLAHPNVVRVYDVGEHAGRTFVAMELVTGDTLRQWLRGTHTVGEVLAVIAQAGRGLAAAHAAGLIHRDLKPDNILIAADGRVLVGDFGLARDASAADEPVATRAGGTGAGGTGAAPAELPADLTLTGALVGTPAYMAPEQSDGEPTAASDQYAFCVTAWEALFGRRPIEGRSIAELRDNARAGRLVRVVVDGRTVPKRVETALRRGLSPVAADRFPSMEELLAALAPPRRRLRWALLAIAVAIAAAVAITFAVTRPQPESDAAACAREGAEIDSTWNRDSIAAIARLHGHDVAARLERYATTWREDRVAACRATRIERRQPTETLARRTACYEDARATFAQQVDQLVRGTGTPAWTLAVLPSLDACSERATAHVAPDRSIDSRGCACPLSACDLDTLRCVSVCDARGYAAGVPVPGVNAVGRQEVLMGASGDGQTLLYAATGLPIAKDAGCNRDRLWLARKRGDTFAPVDVTAQIGIRIREGCCTLSADGATVIVRSADRRAFLAFDVDGDRLTPRPTPILDLRAEIADPESFLWFPVLSADERTLFYLRHAPGADGEPGPLAGSYVATRTDVTAPFTAGKLLGGRARGYEYVTGISADGLTLFMASEYTTRVLVRATTDEAFGPPAVSHIPAELPGWRAVPLADCSRIVTTATPGGCAQEDIIYLDAAR
jgi:predicted Ser/Thr protein kinase